MTAPDLATPEGLAAYRHELRAVARWPRLGGLALIVLGAALMLLQTYGVFGLKPGQLNVAAFAALAVGWVLMALALIQRNRYHRRRMAGE